MNAGSEEVAFDNFRVTGEHDGLSSLPTAASFEISSDTISESAGEYYLPVYLENPSDTVVVVIQTEENSSKTSFLGEELIFIGQKDSVVLSKINIIDDEVIDGLSKLIFNIAEVSGGYESYIKEPSSFTLYITDDDLPAGGEVIMSEIMYDSRSSVDEEWVELYNTTAFPVNISGWYLTDDDSYPADEEGDVLIPDGTFIYPGEYLVLSWKDLPDFDGEVILDKRTGFRSYAPGLANTGDNVALYSNATGTGILVDGSPLVFYSNASPANSGYSIERDLANGYEGNWSSSINNYGDTEIIRGTPGAVNSTLYTAISFASPDKIVSEDSSSIFLPLQIINPSDISDTNAEVILYKGDSTEITGPSFNEIIFPAGSADNQFLQVTIKDDSIIGKTDTLFFKVKKVTGGLNAYVAADSLIQLIIKDNDFTRVDFEADSMQLKEGDSVELNVLITNAHPDQSTSVFIKGEAGADLLFPDSEITIHPGENSAKVVVKAVFDGVEEGPENIKLDLAEVAGGNEAYIGEGASLIIKVVDDHPTTTRFLHEFDTVSESEPIFLLPIVITNPSPETFTTVTIQLLSGDSNDLSGVQHGELTFSSEEADTLYFEIPVFNDSIREGTEQFTFEMATISGGHYSRIVEPAVFTLSIIDDEEKAVNLVFNEVLFDPPADSLKGDANNDGIRSSIEDEFIEIVNSDSLSVDISGFSINDAAAVRHVFPEGTVMASMQGIVVFGGGSPAGDYGGSIVQTASSGRLSLNNSGDEVYLLNKADTIASLSYSGSTGKDQSITRSPDMAGNFAGHLSVSEQLFSPGYQVNGLKFNEILPDPSIHVNTTSIDFGLITAGNQEDNIISYQLNVKKLADTLIVKAPRNFLISSDEANFFNELKFAPNESGVINGNDLITATIYVAFEPGAEGAYQGQIVHTTAWHDEVEISLKAEYLQPVLELSENAIDFDLVFNGDETVKTYFVRGQSLAGEVEILSPSGTYISVTENFINSTNTLVLDPDEKREIQQQIFIDFNPGSEGILADYIMHATKGADTAKIFVEGEFIIPSVEVFPQVLDFDTYYISEEAEKLSYTLSAHSVVGPLKIFCPPGFELALEGDFNEPADSLILEPDSRDIVKTVFVRFNPESIGIFSDSIRHTAYGANDKFVVIKGVADKLTSVSVDQSNFIQVYPNPADNFINIKAKTYSRKNIRLLDTAGREMLYLEFSDNVRLNTSLLEAGLYYLHISSAEEAVKIKAVIIH